MKDNLKIAWRNLWRNKRRTLITTASIFFAVFFAAIMRSYQLGSYDHMISNVIESYSGYLQIQHIDYNDNPNIDNSFTYNDSLEAAISKIPDVLSVTPHLESFALASNGPQTKGVAIIGIDPEKEKKFSNPENKLVKYRITEDAIVKMEESGIFPEAILKKISDNEGRSYSSRARLELEMGLSQSDVEKYITEIMRFCEVRNGFLRNDDDGILVSDRLATFLHAGIGDTVILIGQGYHGASAAGLFEVKGIIKLPAPELDNKVIMMTIPNAWHFLDCPGKITSLSINLENKSSRIIKRAQNNINIIIAGNKTVARTWYELNPILFQQIQGDSQSGMLMLGVLYFIIFFGIFGTVLMMVAERTREFGVLVAIGMQKHRLKKIIVMEMIILGFIGTVAGMIASIPFITYFYYNPIVLKGDLGKMMEDYGWDAIMPTAWFGPYFYWQVVIVAVMVFVTTIYPVRKISRLKEIEAMRS
ncbi:MAG: ABC transporter permease [Bacteroidales bacterium]